MNEPGGWTPVWRDDFAGAAGSRVNGANWLYSTGTGYPGGAPNWGTWEVETMTSSTKNVSLDGAGHLSITPLRDHAGNWTSARVESQRTDFGAPPGGMMRVEASLRQPNVNRSNGAGYWPAFWMLGEGARPVSARNWPLIGELDLMENVNGRDSVWSTLHCGTVSGGPCNETTGLGSGEHPCPECKTGFHTYALEYDRTKTPEQLRWYLDGKLFHTINANQLDSSTWNSALHHGFFIIFNVAMGGAFPEAYGAVKPTDATVSGRPMLVDYVAVSTKGQGTSDSPEASPSPSPSPPTSGTQTRNAYSTLEAEAFDDQSGTAAAAGDVGQISNGDWLLYRGVDFGSTTATQFAAQVASGANAGISGQVEVHLDDRASPPVAKLEMANTGGWQKWQTIRGNMSEATGVHDVYLTFTSGQPDHFVNINSFTFAR